MSSTDMRELISGYMEALKGNNATGKCTLFDIICIPISEWPNMVSLCVLDNAYYLLSWQDQPSSGYDNFEFIFLRSQNT